MSRGDGMTKYQHDKIVRKTKEACANALRDHGYLLKRRGCGTLIYCREAADICMAAEVKTTIHNRKIHQTTRTRSLLRYALGGKQWISKK